MKKIDLEKLVKECVVEILKESGNPDVSVNKSPLELELDKVKAGYKPYPDGNNSIQLFYKHSNMKEDDVRKLADTFNYSIASASGPSFILTPKDISENDEQPTTQVSELKRTQTDFEGGKKPRGLTHPPIKSKVKLELKSKAGEPVLTQSQDVDVFFSDKTPSNVYIFSNGKWWSINLQNGFKFLTRFSATPSINKLESMSNSGIATTPIGNRVEPDGKGPNGDPSWMLVMGLI